MKKVVCPKCQAKLKFDPERITAEVTKFRCPGCKSFLRFRKPGRENKLSSSHSTSRRELNADEKIRDSGAELQEMAHQFEEEMGFARNDVADAPKQAGPQTETQGEKQKEAPGEQEFDRDDPEKTVAEEGRATDSREFRRVKFKKKVLINNQILVEALDISQKGLFLHTGRSFEDGTVVEVGIPTLPGNFDLRIEAVVRHNHRGIGMGLEFVDLDEKQKMQLNKLIGGLDEAAAKELEGRKKILLVGGTDTARNINKSKLVLDGFYVLQTTDPQEVFTLLEEEQPDALVLEWQETAFNSPGLLAKINANQNFASIIKVVLAILTDTSVQREILDAGAHRCMAKMDTNPAKLSLTLRQLIEERDG